MPCCACGRKAVGHRLLCKPQVAPALPVLCAVVGLGALAQIFAAFSSDLTKDLYNHILLLKTSLEAGPGSGFLASLQRRCGMWVTTTAAEAAASSIPGRSWGAGRAGLPAPWGAPFVGRKSSCFLRQPLPWQGEAGQPCRPRQGRDAASTWFLTCVMRLCQ